MSESNSTSPAWSGPGIIQTFISIPETSALSESTLLKWLDEVYIPGAIDTGIVKSAWRFKAADPAYSKPHLVILKIPDMAPVAAKKLHAVPTTSDMFPTSESVETFVEYESRNYSLLQLYETKKQPEDAASTIICAGMEPNPGGEADLDAWYREEHNQQMSEQAGWVRSTRFKVLFQYRPDGKETQRISYLAIHEFGEGHDLGIEVKPLDPMTDWTKKCMSEAKAIEAAIYTRVKSFGKAA